MTIRVAAFLNTVAVSGPGRQLAAVAERLREHDIDVTAICVVAPDDTESPFTRLLRSHGVPYVAIPTDGRMSRRFMDDVAAVIARIDPHIVQSHSYRPAYIAWRLRRLRPTWKWVGFFHGDTHEDLKVRVYNAVDRWLLQRTDHTVVVARAQLPRFRRARSLSHIANAVISLPVHNRSGSVPGNDGVPTVARIGCIGRLSREKGIDLLLRAIGSTTLATTPLELLIAGEGPMDSELRAMTVELGLEHRVRFLGAVDDMGALYRSLDLLVLSSLTEGMPNVLLEAAYYDVPMVATRVGDVPDILSSDEAGLVVASGDTAALADAISRALARGRTVEGSAARAAIRKRYSLESRAAAHAALYRRLAGVSAAVSADVTTGIAK